MRARTGKARDEKIGAVVNKPSTRRNGHSTGDSQAMSWASVKVSTRGAGGYRTICGIDSIVRRM